MGEGAETVITTKPDPNSRSCPGDVEIPNRIFVKGFPKETEDNELKEFFEIYGIVHDANIVRDPSGAKKGYAFVTFDSQEIACKVKDMGIIPYQDRELVIGSAKIRKKRPIFTPNYYQQQSAPEQYWIIPQDQIPPCFVSPDGTHFYQPSFNQAIPVMATTQRGSSHYQIEQAPYYDPYHQTQQQHPQQQYSVPISYTPAPAEQQPSGQYYSVSPVTTSTLTTHQQPAIQIQQQGPPMQQAEMNQQVIKTTLPSMQTAVPTMTYSPGYPVYVNAISDGMNNMIISDPHQQYVTMTSPTTEMHREIKSPPIIQTRTVAPTMACNTPQYHTMPVHYEGQYVQRRDESQKMVSTKTNEAQMVPNVLYVDASMKTVKMISQEQCVPVKVV